MKLPFLGSLGLNTQTGVLIAAAGLAAFYVLHNMGTSGVSVSPPVKSTPIPARSKSPDEIYDLDDTDDDPLYMPQKIGFTVPISIGRGSDIYGHDTRALRKTWPAEELTFDNAYDIPHPILMMPHAANNLNLHVANSGYNAYNNAARADGSSYYASRAYEGTTTDDVATTSTTTTTTPAATDPAVLDLQDRILKIIVRRTNNVNTILSNLETIKAEIQTYTAKLQLALQQQTAGLINQAQMAQYLESIVTEITTKLKISIAPSFNDNSVPTYYQQYFQDYQKYINQLNSNYYDYYQPSYQYYPGQTYDYYQPYQYQYPSPYYPNGQYPTNYPSYNYGYGTGYGAATTGQGIVIGYGANVDLDTLPPGSHVGYGARVNLKYPPGPGVTYGYGSVVTVNGRPFNTSSSSIF